MLGYWNFTKKDWLERYFKISEEMVPDLFICEGRFNYPKAVEDRGAVLTDPRVIGMPNTILGRFDDKYVSYGCAFGAPMASQLTHLFGKIGVPRVVQIGMCGTFNPELDIGDIIVATGAHSFDGTAGHYGVESDIPASEGLVDRIKGLCGEKGVTCSTGKIATYFDIMLEKEKDMVRLAEEGYRGIEMETAAVFAVARHFGMEYGAILMVMDNMATKKDVLHEMDEREKERFREGMRLQYEVALGCLGDDN